jgi:hypothetical protein
LAGALDLTMCSDISMRQDPGLSAQAEVAEAMRLKRERELGESRKGGERLWQSNPKKYEGKGGRRGCNVGFARQPTDSELAAMPSGQVGLTMRERGEWVAEHKKAGIQAATFCTEAKLYTGNGGYFGRSRLVDG